jgi:hypothetical protein
MLVAPSRFLCRRQSALWARRHGVAADERRSARLDRTLFKPQKPDYSTPAR